MSDYVLLTDSSADLTAELVAELGVEVLPLSFHMGDKTYRNWPDNREIDPKDFYRRLRAGETATTSAVNVSDYTEAVEPLVQAGRDVLIIAFSSGLSATCHSAQIAAQELSERYPDRKIWVVDSLCASLGVEYRLRRTRLGEIIFEERKEKNPCSLCARMRRGYLYEEAKKLGCNKIALGHHFDDAIETILMGVLYSGQMQGMPPKLHSTSHPGMQLIRPLYHVHERDIERWRDHCGLRFLACACRFTEHCETHEEDSKRREVKRLIAAGQIATQYVGADGKPSMDIDANPNGSLEAIEGIFSPDGRVFGKMGHSERRGPYVGVNIPGDKHQPLFESGAEYFR